jgi:lipopolysaccharide/colanic/teichoic acid biosynthesis glycosyltransferase
MIAPVPSRIVYRRNVRYERVSRVIDIVLVSCAMIVALPLIALGAAAIALEGGGSPFFVQNRVGRYGRIFRIYKLRTMKPEACVDALSPTSSRDPRITRVGAFLRKTSIDELPQLFNVLIGDMALVGPRPEMPHVVRTYARWQHLRHLARPGLTGLWQTTCRSIIPLADPKATELDLEYVRTASHGTDLFLILRTIVIVLAMKGAW